MYLYAGVCDPSGVTGTCQCARQLVDDTVDDVYTDHSSEVLSFHLHSTTYVVLGAACLFDLHTQGKDGRAEEEEDVGGGV